MRRPRSPFIAVFAVFALAAAAATQEKGGQEEFGPYEVVPNWPQPLPGPENQAWTWGSTGGVYAESPNRIWIGMRGQLPMPDKAKPGESYGQHKLNANAARANVHLKVLYGRSSHHQIEAMFKAFARALRVASAKDRRLARTLPSTKGLL